MATSNYMDGMKNKLKSPGAVLTGLGPKSQNLATVGAMPKAPGIPIPKQKISIAPPQAPVQLQAGPGFAPTLDEKVEVVVEGLIPSVAASPTPIPSLPKTLATQQNGVGTIKPAAKPKEAHGTSSKRASVEKEEKSSSEGESGSDEDDGDDSSSSASSSEGEEGEEEDDDEEEESEKEKKPASKKASSNSTKKRESEEKPAAKKREDKKHEGASKAHPSKKSKKAVEDTPTHPRFPFTIEKTASIPPEFSRKILAERPKVTDAHHALHEKFENAHRSFYADMEVAGYKMVQSMNMHPDSIKRRTEAFAEAEKLEADKNSGGGKKTDSQVAATAYVKRLSATRNLDFDVWFHEGRNQAVLASDFRAKEHLNQNPQLDGPEAYRRVRFVLGRVLSRFACGVPHKVQGRDINRRNIIYYTSTIFTQKSFSGEAGTSPDNRKWVPDILYTKDQIEREEAALAEHSEEEEEEKEEEEKEKEKEKPQVKKTTKKRPEEDTQKPSSKKAKAAVPVPPPPSVAPPPPAAAAAAVVPIVASNPEVSPILKQLLEGQTTMIQQQNVVIAQNEAIKALFSQVYAKMLFSDQ